MAADRRPSPTYCGSPATATRSSASPPASTSRRARPPYADRWIESMTFTWIITPISADLLRGALDVEYTARGVLPHRLPARARAQYTDAQLAMVEAQPAGVRLAFRTRATAVELDTLPIRYLYTGLPPRPDGVYDLLV